MGVAYLARSKGAAGFERLVVVKRMHAHLTDHPEPVARFLAEARQASVLHHANVVGVHHVGRDDRGYFLVLEYVEGAALDELSDRAALRMAELPVPILLRIVLDACQGLQAVHEATGVRGEPLGMLHRDISPQNLIVGVDGVTRVADFGIAKSALAAVSTDANYMVGKLLFMPREYLSREPVACNLDVYSLGMTLWVTLAGRSPWEGASEAQLVTHILKDDVPPLSALGISIAPQLQELLDRAVAANPRERFASAAEMAAQIEHIGRHTGWLATHGEVAALVRQLAGHDLEARRQSLNLELERLRTVAPTPASGAPARGARSSKLGWIVGAVGAFAALAAVGFVATAVSSNDGEATNSEATASAVGAAPSADSARVSSSQATSAAAVPTPAASAQPAPVQPEPETKPTPASEARPKPEPRPDPATPAEPSGDGITKTNPYRK